MKTAILISSCPKYLQLARWTGSRIADLWEDHPPLFYSGCLESGGRGDLVMRSDGRDWMAVTRDAVSDLRSRGFTHAYLILDDHPPLEKCHPAFLNQLLPDVASRLGAVYVGLLGCGQHRAGRGEDLGKSGLWLERSARGYRWRFSLHPGLWSLAALDELLEIRMSQYPVTGHTPWNFERHRDQDDQPVRLPETFAGACYRVRGSRFDAAPHRLARTVQQQALHAFFDVALFATRITRGRDERERMSARWLWAYSYYRGPYPMFWSGVMMQGKQNPHLSKFLKATGRSALLRSLDDVAHLFP